MAYFHQHQYCIILHITVFRNAFIFVHAYCVTSVNWIYNTIFKQCCHSRLSLNSQSELSASRQINTGHYFEKKTLTLWPPTCIIAVFSGRKWAFKPLSKAQIIPFRFPGFSDVVYFTSNSLVEKNEIKKIHGHDISLLNCRRKTVQRGRVSDGALSPERHRVTCSHKGISFFAAPFSQVSSYTSISLRLEASVSSPALLTLFLKAIPPIKGYTLPVNRSLML